MATHCRVHALLCWSEQACRRIHDQLHPWSSISAAIVFNPLTCMLNYSSQFMTVNTLSLRSQSKDEHSYKYLTNSTVKHISVNNWISIPQYLKSIS